MCLAATGCARHRTVCLRFAPFSSPLFFYFLFRNRSPDRIDGQMRRNFALAERERILLHHVSSVSSRVFPNKTFGDVRRHFIYALYILFVRFFLAFLLGLFALTLLASWRRKICKYSSACLWSSSRLRRWRQHTVAQPSMGDDDDDSEVYLLSS